jgi:phosphoserine aminotransferase
VSDKERMIIMDKRIYNFYAGPAALPQEVLIRAQSEMLNYKDTGMSVMEISHRSQEFEEIINDAEKLFKEILAVGEEYKILFLQGGASTQFYTIPMNFLTEDKTADYILTGSWSEKALKEAQKIGKTHIAASTKEVNCIKIPDMNEIQLSDNPAYLHITSNNTIFGTQWQQFPDFKNVPLFADMSSDILSRKFDASKFDLIYAGAQKNLGPSGVTVVIIKKELLEKSAPALPTMINYKTHIEKNSMFNTPPCYSVYILKMVLEWIIEKGGLSAIEEINNKKASYIYEVIDNSGGFYKGHSEKTSRSNMNITFTVENKDLEEKFVKEAASKCMVGLKGHRSIGGLRASVYNAMPTEGCTALADFMKQFQKQNS